MSLTYEELSISLTVLVLAVAELAIFESFVWTSGLFLLIVLTGCIEMLPGVNAGTWLTLEATDCLVN